MSDDNKHDAPNLAELLDGVRELGGDISASFSLSGLTAMFEVKLPGLKLQYNIQGNSAQECILNFAKRFKPSFEYFAEQHVEYTSQQLHDAMMGVIQRSSTEKSATTEDEAHQKTPE